MSRRMSKPTKWHMRLAKTPVRLVRVFALCMKKAGVLSYPSSAQRRLWSNWMDAQADLILRWAHMPFSWFRHEAAHTHKITTGYHPRWIFNDKYKQWCCQLGKMELLFIWLIVFISGPAINSHKNCWSSLSEKKHTSKTVYYRNCAFCWQCRAISCWQHHVLSTISY